MRLFLAVDPGQRFRDLLATQLDAWRNQLRIAWSRPQTWHLTLAFLAEWPADRVPDLEQALAAEALRHARFNLQPGRLDAFPDLSRPRVLFLQMGSDGSLQELAAGVRARVDAVYPDGPQDRKPFRAHLTVARIKQALPVSQRGLVGQIQFVPFEPVEVTEFKLVRSDFTSGGVRHTPLAVFELGQDPS